MIRNHFSRMFSVPQLRRWQHESAAAVLLSVGGLLLGCSGSGDTTDPVSLSPTQAFWAVQLDKHAVNLALTPPYDTVRLTAHILNAAGSPLAGVTGQVHYSFPDSSVTVDSTGLLHAHYVTNATYVDASVHGARRHPV